MSEFKKKQTKMNLWFYRLKASQSLSDKPNGVTLWEIRVTSLTGGVTEVYYLQISK